MTFDFSLWLELWRLEADGDAFGTATGHLLPVRRDGRSLMLKIATGDEERAGAHLLVWWQGGAAADVLEHAGDAILMARALDPTKLVAMSEAGEDDAAVRIMVDVVGRLHRSRQEPPPSTLIPMERRLRSLFRAAATDLAAARVADLARTLLAAPTDETVLHGDIQHYNVLDFGDGDWRVIDPKGMLGERTYDYANIVCNPTAAIALAPGRFARRVDLIAAGANLDRSRLLQWIVVWAQLSATWHDEDGTDGTTARAITALAQSELARA